MQIFLGRALTLDVQGSDTVEVVKAKVEVGARCSLPAVACEGSVERRRGCAGGKVRGGSACKPARCH